MATPLESICDSLGIPVRVIETRVAPQLHRVRLEPVENGRGRLTKLCSIRNRTEDIGLAIDAYPINTTQDQDGFWLEVPKTQRSMVSLDDIEPNALVGKRLPVALGVSVYNRPLVIDLADDSTPHVLIAGTTGSGKTVLLKAIITNLLRRACHFRMAIVDTKRDLDVFSKDRSLIHFEDNGQFVTDNVIGDADTAAIAFDALYQECQKRQEQSDKQREQNPRIAVVVDEFADLVLTDKDMSEKTIKLSQIARGAGIHLILATQRPSREVVTGLIKANFPVRVALRTVSAIDSKIILDAHGAEKLLGKGDGLALLKGSLIRFQAPYVSDEQIAEIIRKERNG